MRGVISRARRLTTPTSFLARLRSALFIAVILAQAPAQADETHPTASIGERIGRHAVVRAEFEQRKEMATLKRPLISRGHLVFARRYGVLWQIEQPYRMTYVLGADHIVEIAANGTRRERAANEVPGLAQVARIFRDLLGADTKALEEVFVVSMAPPAPAGNAWSLELRPRQAQLAQFLTGLRLSGHDFVETIVIDEGRAENGRDGSAASTQIRLSNSQAATEPSAPELSLFQLGAPAQQ